MLTAAILTNFVLATFCFYLAWQIWQLSRALAVVADTVLEYDRNTHKSLSVAPAGIDQAQSGVQQLRQQQQKLEQQLQQVRQVLSLFSLGRGVWLRSTQSRRSLPKVTRPVRRSSRP